MLKNEVIIKVLGKIATEMGGYIDQIKVRTILEEVLYDYEIDTKCQALTVSSDLQNKIFLFLASKKIDGLSMKSLYNYKLQLTRFTSYIQKNTIDIDTMDIRIFLARITKDRGLSQSSIGTLMSILKSFFSWLENEDYIIKSPLRKIKSPKKPKNLRKSLTVEQIELLRDGCITLRQRALLEVLISTGCRVSEVVDINVNDLDWNNLSLKVKGKGSKEREVFFTAKAKIHIRKYLLGRPDNNLSLFIASKKPYNRLGGRAIQRELKKIAENAGFDLSIYPHLMRHSMATTALNSGVSLVSLQNILGHETVSTTQIYAKINNVEVKHEYRKYMTI